MFSAKKRFAAKTERTHAVQKEHKSSKSLTKCLTFTINKSQARLKAFCLFKTSDSNDSKLHFQFANLLFALLS
jgi:hypothetical protein